MSYPPHIWDQLKNLTKGDLIKALEKDGWQCDSKKGAEQVFWNPDGRRVSVHYHVKTTFGPNLLKNLLKDIGWTQDDFVRLKLIKR